MASARLLDAFRSSSPRSCNLRLRVDNLSPAIRRLCDKKHCNQDCCGRSTHTCSGNVFPKYEDGLICGMVTQKISIGETRPNRSLSVRWLDVVLSCIVSQLSAERSMRNLGLPSLVFVACAPLRSTDQTSSRQPSERRPKESHRKTSVLRAQMPLQFVPMFI